jgi:hemophore
MTTTTGVVRRSLFAAFAATVAGGALVAALASPSATAAPDPCAASEIAKTIGSVANDTGAYLEDHPQTNTVLTTISKQQSGPQSLAALKAYFDANPQVAKEMQQLQQPLTSLSGKCSLPLTFPQLLGMMQAAQQGGGPAPSLPAQLPTAHAVGLPAASTPAQTPAATTNSQGGGLLPGSALAGLP